MDMLPQNDFQNRFSELVFEFTHLMEDAGIFISVLPLALWLLAGTNVLGSWK